MADKRLVCVGVFMLAHLLGLAASEAVFKVSQFGARPDTGTDQLTPIAAALHASASVPNATLLFDLVGEYRLSGHLQVTNAEGLTIDGRGSMLVYTTWSMAIHAIQPNRLRIQNLFFDYDPLPNVGGMVVGLDAQARWLDVAVDPNIYDFNSALGKNVSAYIGYVPSGHHFNGSVDRYLSTNPPTTIRSPISYTHLTPFPVLRVQDYVSALYIGQYLWVRLSPVCTHSLVMSSRGLEQARDVVVENVTLYSSPCMGLVMNGFNLTLRGYHVLKRGQRYGSINADCIHLTGLRGHFIFEDSLLEGSGDDGLNINNQNSEVVEIIDSTTIAVSANMERKKLAGPSVFLPGDVLSFSHPETAFQTYAQVTVADRTPHATNTTIRFTTPLPTGIRTMDIVSNNEIASAFIRNVTVRSNRARGFLIKNKNTLIEDCKLYNHTAAAMQIATDCGYWWEGRPPYNVTVRRTHVKGPYQSVSNLSNNPSCACAAILMMVEFVPPGMPQAPPGGVTDILFENNLFEDIPVGAFYIGSSRNVTIRSNVIRGIELSPLVYCNSENVKVYNNRLLNAINSTSLFDPRCDRSLSRNIDDSHAWDGSWLMQMVSNIMQRLHAVVQALLPGRD